MVYFFVSWNGKFVSLPHLHHPWNAFGTLHFLCLCTCVCLLVLCVCAGAQVRRPTVEELMDPNGQYVKRQVDVSHSPDTHYTHTHIHKPLN